MTRRDRLRRPHVLMTDEPGVLVHNPRRHFVRLLVLYAVLPLICAAAGAFIAYQLGNARTDRRVDALEADLAERRQVNADSNRARDARLEQTRRDLCVVIDRVQPRDQAVEEVRRRYGCTGTPPSSPPSSTSPRTPPPSGGRTPGGGRTSTAGGGAAPAPRPAPAPGPPGPPGPTGPPAIPPSPPPPDPGDDGLVCLPLVGCVL